MTNNEDYPIPQSDHCLLSFSKKKNYFMTYYFILKHSFNILNFGVEYFELVKDDMVGTLASALQGIRSLSFTLNKLAPSVYCKAVVVRPLFISFYVTGRIKCENARRGVESL